MHTLAADGSARSRPSQHPGSSPTGQPHAGVSSLGVECRNNRRARSRSPTLREHAIPRLRATWDRAPNRRTATPCAIEAERRQTDGAFPAIAEADGVELHYAAYCDTLDFPLPRERVQRYGQAKWV